MKTTLNAFVILTIMTFVAPFPVLAGKVAIEQVKQNVINLQNGVEKAQPATTITKFRQILLKGEQKFILLDVRSEAEFNAGHLPGALNVERGRIEWFIPNIIKDTEKYIYVYCRSGMRSAFATERLLELGYANVIHIKEGFQGWLKAGYSIYNQHGEFVVTHGGIEKREPMIISQ